MNFYKKLSIQVARWVDVLQQYDYSFRHGPEIQMKYVNALSRAPVDQKKEQMVEGYIGYTLLCVYNTIKIRTSHRGKQ